eukprot:3689767-Pyramimonas_sp.AAC.1
MEPHRPQVHHHCLRPRNIIITWDYGGVIITYDYGDIILTNVMDIIIIVPYCTNYDIIRNTDGGSPRDPQVPRASDPNAPAFQSHLWRNRSEPRAQIPATSISSISA